MSGRFRQNRIANVDRNNKTRWNFRGRNYGRPSFGGRYRSQNSRCGNANRLSHKGDVDDSSTPEDNAPITDLTESFIDRAQVVHVHRRKPSNALYPSWELYMKDGDCNVSSTVVQKVKAIQKYIRNDWNSDCNEDTTQKRWENLKTELESKAAFVINVKELVAEQTALDLWPNIYDDIRERPEDAINCIGLAMHETVAEKIRSEANSQLLRSEIVNLPKLNARLLNFEPLLLINKIKSKYFNQFVSVRGTVVKVGSSKPRCTKMAFRCVRCRITQVLTQPYGKYTAPTTCLTKGCNSHFFEPLRSSTLTETVDWQCIRLQETKANDKQHAGSMPRTIRCELMHDLVDSCVPGDEVVLSGIVKVMESDDSGQNYRQRANIEQCRFHLYIYANSVTKSKSSHASVNRQNMADVNSGYTEKELYAVKSIFEEENLFRLLTASLCPSIYGHEIIKAGLLLGLFGGTQKYRDDENKIPIRGNPHILVVGDPGLGKSQMLQSCSSVAPRGVYVCGNTTSVSGLTVTLNREGSGGDYSLEAGALVLSDRGCCCIDEFDKMTNQHSALLEAMEQQSISLPNAGMCCNLPARASILAAANPVGGHYNKAKTVA